MHEYVTVSETETDIVEMKRERVKRGMYGLTLL